MGGRRLDGDLLAEPDRLLVGVVRGVWEASWLEVVGGEPAPTASAVTPPSLHPGRDGDVELSRSGNESRFILALNVRNLDDMLPRVNLI